MSASFAKLLKGVMNRCHLRESDVGVWANVSTGTVADWILGKATPEYDYQVASIIEGCRQKGCILSEAEIDELYDVSGLQRPSRVPQTDRDANLINSPEGWRGVIEQLTAVQTTLQILKDQTTSDDDKRTLSHIEQMLQQTVNVRDWVRERFVVVQQEPTTIKWVPVHEMYDELLRADMERLDDAHDDENLAFAAIGLVGGAFFGVIVNMVTAGGISTTIIPLVFLTLATVAAGLWLRRLRQRSAKVREDLEVKWRIRSSEAVPVEEH